MNLKELLSKISINLFIKKQNNLKKIMPVLDNEYSALDIFEEEEEENLKEDSKEYIDLELGNGNQLISEEKMWYFYNKV